MLYCYFMDFKKAFIYCTQKCALEKMAKLRKFLKNRAIVAQLYDYIKCRLKMDNIFSKYLLSNTGVQYIDT